MAHDVHRFDRALLRAVPSSAVNGLRSVDRGAPNIGRLRAEHAAYAAALEAAGVAVEILPALEDYPDSLFVEDPALVFGEGAILLRPGAESRRGEVAAIAPELEARFPRVLRLEAGHADGGDVLVTPDKVMIGLSARTDRPGAERLAGLLAELGRAAEIVEPPEGVLHLKTACSLLDARTVLATRQLANRSIFDGLNIVVVPDGEEAAANALAVNDAVLLGAAFPRTRELLERRGHQVVTLSVEEVGKLDAGLSCMSLRWLAG